ncbi:group II intron maturase-specific domain-containing protein [Ferviditalea candida]|uniref:Group II intron maturase-specific domain-containing protein n=1 Tax=Ferviditalea candida TaxID=3108399 RepID=A0ABU5ZNQ2_9BACL|nr:group II intron maturase-specific domain-containing protein [Paenibacillaceae bacterium T2]
MDRPWKRKFLGFSFTVQKDARIRISPKSLKRVEYKIREITNPTWSISMEERIRRLNQYLMGYDGLLRTHGDSNALRALEEWTRRRLRLCLWHRRKRVRTRIRELRSLGLKEREVFEIANTRKGAWRTREPLIYIKSLELPIGNPKDSRV